MDRKYAVSVIYEIINSNIIKEELEEDLRQIALAIERDDLVGEIEIPRKGRGC